MSENLPLDVIAEIVRRISRAFPVPHMGIHDCGDLQSHDVSNMLGINEGTEFDFLMGMGVLSSVTGDSRLDRRVPKAEMLRFLELHGDTWVLARLEMLREKLRDGLKGAHE